MLGVLQRGVALGKTGIYIRQGLVRITGIEAGVVIEA
jgi:hypothetical protein